ncbi:uncharacterized protein [Physcomitrium patens]|uniref:uncharacterized protein isoform X1 n=2 Tax=Physcomitrium patens TaxID=3218 RepID=UPI000D15228B|nr:uncharacterized protein LOC112277346 isoform X1 [Physcomitrium patens]|eukprot:XP_024365304.1 uncharacterized protein LOC112277346 isoform X1 [Physcomitrella patens]
MTAMARREGTGRGRLLPRQERGSGECSTSVESSSRISCVMPFPNASAVGTSTQWRKGKNNSSWQHDPDDCTRDSCYDDRRKKVTPKNTSADTSTKPLLEAYSNGSWWDVEILKKNRDKYYVHYVKFGNQIVQWVPFGHLRMRSRTSQLLDCDGIKPGVDVCVMSQHPHANESSRAWYDAKVVDVTRKQHTPKTCKCFFQIALYTIPTTLPCNHRERLLLPNYAKPVGLGEMHIMREARGITFQQVVSASLPSVTNIPRVWAKDGILWCSSFCDYSDTSRRRSLSFESRVAGGNSGPSLSQGPEEPTSVPGSLPLVSFDSFLAEEGIILSDGKDEDDLIVSPVPNSYAPIPASGGEVSDEDDVILLSGNSFHAPVPPSRDGVKPFPVLNASKTQPIVFDINDETDVEEVVPKTIPQKEDTTEMPDFAFIERYSSDEMEQSSEKLEDVSNTAETSGNSDEDLDELVLSKIPFSKPGGQSPLKPMSVTSDMSSPLPSFRDVPFGPETSPIVEPATFSENSDEHVNADYIERTIAGSRVAKRRLVNNQTTCRENLNPPFTSRFQTQGRPKKKLLSRAGQQCPEQGCLNNAVKEQVKVYASEQFETLGMALIRPSVKGGKRLNNIDTMGVKEFADDLKGHPLTVSPVMPDILARSKDGSKTGLLKQLLRQTCLPKAKRPKRVGTIAGPRNVEKEITYAELFETVDPVHCYIAEEKVSEAEGMGLSPSWNPLMNAVGPTLLQEVQDDPLAYVWEEMRAAQESCKKVNGAMDEKSPDSTSLIAECENPDGSKCQEHAVIFDQEVGIVCAVCGNVLLEIENMWERDNAKRITATKDNDEDIYDENMLASWDFEDLSHKQQDSIEKGSNFELIPELAKHMQRHQKHGFQFLWRNLAGQDANGNPCFPPREPGGCVISHAPGTGKTFLIISFLHSYIKKYPHCRPVIVAPKIMLQPWEREFRKWNVGIPVYNFNKAAEQGRIFLQQHEEAGDVQLNSGGRWKKQRSMNACREAMLWQWTKTPSVLVISYSMFALMTTQERMTSSTVRTILLERPHILVLDEGHFARNSRAQILKPLMAVKTPLRIMLSGTLFQNNFEELYTSLNLVRSGFVKTYAKDAGLKFNIQQGCQHRLQEIELKGDDEVEHHTAEWKEKAAKAAEVQAKKLFMEEVGNKIDKGQKGELSPGSLAQGLEQLRRLTSPFIHHYKGGVLRDLPPLRDFAIMLQPTALQVKLVQSVTRRLEDKTMLERECLLSLICIHPSLFLEHNVGKALTDLLSQEEMNEVATNRDPEVGVKTRFVINLLNQLRYGQEKILIFCQNLVPFILLEEMLKNEFGWVREQEILQLDGKVDPDERQSIIERFNDRKGKIRVLLASTKACGEGITLTGASRVVFMDVLWNPAVIRQAIHRAFRIGQRNAVHVYRLVASGTMEESKYQRMVSKDWKSQSIFRGSDENIIGEVQHCFWEVKKQTSKDPALNELRRQDEALDQPAFKHIFRHGGLFDDDYSDDPDGRGIDATDWLRGIEDSDSYDIDAYDDSADGDNDDFEILEEIILSKFVE